MDACAHTVNHHGHFEIYPQEQPCLICLEICNGAEVASVDENKCNYPGRCESPDSCQITAKQHHKTGGSASQHHFLGS